MSEDRVICPHCQAEGKTSKVYRRQRAHFTTDMYFGPFYDELGVRHRHDDNDVTMQCDCSNGHAFALGLFNPCPADGCDWNDAQRAKGLVPV